MDYTIFSHQFLVAAYLAARANGGQTVRSAEILDKYRFDVTPMWVHTALRDWRDKGWVSGSGTLGDERSQPIRLTGEGLIQAEVFLKIEQFIPQEREPSYDEAATSRRSSSGSKFRDFEDSIMLALYEAWRDGRGMVALAGVAAGAGLQYERGWLVRVHDSLKSKGFLDGPANRRIEEMTAGQLSAAGLQYVEDNLLDEEEASGVGRSDISVQSEAATGFAHDVAPASDRLVRLDHNSPEFKRVLEGIDDLREEVRATNDPSLHPDERERLLISLSSASTLWAAVQLKVIQIKVGVVMAIEDARTALVSVGRAVGAALLVDTIKALIKSHTGIDLDHM